MADDIKVIRCDRFICRLITGSKGHDADLTPNNADGIISSLTIDGAIQVDWSGNNGLQKLSESCRKIIFLTGGGCQSHNEKRLFDTLFDRNNNYELDGWGYSALLYDRDKNKIICLRDRYGIEPLYILQNCKTIYIANSLREISRYTRHEINRSYVWDCLIQNFSSYETPIKGITILPPGHRIVIEHVGRYNRLVKQKTDNIKLPDRGERVDPALIKNLRNSLCEAIEKYSNGGDVHIIFSGGLDSAILAKLAQRELGKRVFTYTFRAGGPGVAGEAGLEEVFDLIGLDKDHHTWVSAEEEQLLELTVKACRRTGAITPFLHGGARMALMNEVTTRTDKCISGEGADEYFVGYPYMVRQNNPDSPSSSTMHWAGRAADHSNPRHDFVEELKKNVARLWLEGCPESTIINDPVIGPSDVRDRQVRWDKRYILGNYILRHLGRELDRHSGVKAYMPYLDEKVTDTAEGISFSQHLSDRRGKSVLRTLAKQYHLLDEKILSRPKQGFIVGLTKGSRWRNSDVIRACLTDTSISDTGLFDPREIKSFLNMQADAIDVYNAMLMTSILTAQIVSGNRPWALTEEKGSGMSC